MEEKLQALNRLDRGGETMYKVAQDYSVGHVTVGDWKKNRELIEKWRLARVPTDVLKDTKTIQKCEYEQVSEALHIWFTHRRDRGVPSLGPYFKKSINIS